MRRVIALACCFALWAATAPSSAQTFAQTSAQAGDWHDAVSSLLDRRARAVREGDRAAFMGTMAGASKVFREQQAVWFDRIQRAPLGDYRLVLDPHGYDDLASALRKAPAGDEVHVVTVAERFALRDYDRPPGDEWLIYTVVRRGARWAIVADDGLDDLGLMSARGMWHFAPVRTVERDGVMVLFHDGEPAARRILGATVAARARVRSKWSLPWDRHIVVMIPRSADELGRILQTTFDLGPFVAFTAASLHRGTGGEWDLVGYRVFVQPGTFFDTSTGFQDDTLGHELVHYAARPFAGPFTTSWLEEGTAQEFGEQAARPYGFLDQHARSIDHLPEDHEFFIGGRESIHLSYQASSHFAAYLIDRFSRDRVARFYRVLGAESPVSFGTGRYHLDRAAREVLGVGFDGLERAWIDRVREEFG